MKTTAQQQMTTERNALGLSLLANVQLASLEQAYTAGAAYQPRADFSHRHDPKPAGFRGHCFQHTHHIRGGNP